MLRLEIASRIVALLGVGALVACSDGSPVSPTVAPNATGALHVQSQAVAGSYQLSFFKSGPNGLEPVTSLPVVTPGLPTSELILGAHVEDLSGTPAQRGSVTFQYCSLKGRPSNDINRPDEAPSASCADGSASWANLGSVAVSASGNAFLNFGLMRIPRVVGFRCKYSGRGTSIVSGVCAPRDFTWTAAP